MTALTTAGLRAQAERLAATLTRHRRTVHRYPEVGFAEHTTAAYIEVELDRLGVRHRRVVGTGVVAVVGAGQRCIGVRADMDALPVAEAPGREGYRSENDGISHACGHDAHVAIVLGLAELLAAAPALDGTVALYFQPAEEGPGGGAPMVAAGVLHDPAPQAVVSLHVEAEHPTGMIALRAGPSQASDDTVRVLLRGVGGHAAYPHLATDPLPAAAAVITGVQQLLTREVDPVQPALFTFGSVHGGTRHNVIAPEVRLEGTLRTLDARNRELLLVRIPEFISAVAAAHGVTADVTVEKGYPVGVNDPALTDLVEEAARAVVPDAPILREPEPAMGAEDFYEFGSTGLPVTMFNLGVRNAAKGITGSHHAPDFDLDEDALPVGLAVLAETVRRFLAP